MTKKQEKEIRLQELNLLGEYFAEKSLDKYDLAQYVIQRTKEIVNTQEE